MSFWHMYRLMDRIMDDYIRELANHDQQAVAPYWGQAGRSILHDANQAHQVVDDDDRFAVSIDVSQFKPEELKVNLNGRTITVEGRQECKDDHSFMARSFVRSWVLPENAIVEELRTQLDDHGKLTIEAPKDESASASTAREIPIRPTKRKSKSKSKSSRKSRSSGSCKCSKSSKPSKSSKSSK
ncbi:hypothetical protein Aduo_007341 [Ancylostoma duodenale]